MGVVPHQGQVMADVGLALGLKGGLTGFSDFTGNLADGMVTLVWTNCYPALPNWIA